jgi:hypothetical protein
MYSQIPSGGWRKATAKRNTCEQEASSVAMNPIPEKWASLQRLGLRASWFFAVDFPFLRSYFEMAHQKPSATGLV